MTRRRNGCPRGRRALLLHVDDELPIDERLNLEVHVEGCAACRDALAFHLEVERVLHLDAGLEPDADFERRIATGVRARLLTAAAANSRPRRAPLALAAAAVLLVLWSPAGDRQPAPDAVRTIGHSPPRAISAAPIAAAALPAAELAGDDPADRLEPARLLAAQQTVRNALLLACSHPDFRMSFQASTTPLVAERWPVTTMVMAAIDDADAGLANAALTGAAALDLKSALPAIRRASRRQATAANAVRALCQLGDSTALGILRPGLDDADLRDAAVEGLALLGTVEAAQILAERLTDTELEPLAAAALGRMGPTGLRELLRARWRGLPAAGTVLGTLPTLTVDLPGLLDVAETDEVLYPAIALGAGAGAPAFAALGDLLVRPHLRPAVLSALLDAVDARALAQITAAISRGDLGDAQAVPMLRRGLDALLDRQAAARELAGRPGHELLVPALLLAPIDTTGLHDLLVDPTVEPDVRAAAAEALAGVDALAADDAVQAALTLMYSHDEVAVRLFLAAARAGLRADQQARLEPLPRAAAQAILARAVIVGERWRRDGTPPFLHEQRKLLKLLRSALPRL